MRERFDLYDFFGTPDDENCLQKCYYYTKYATVGGSIFAVYEMALISKPVTAAASISRFFHLSLPCVGAGAMYGVTTCLAAKIRKRDDLGNHVLGSLGALSAFVAKYNRMMLAFPCAVVFASTMGYFKYMRQHDLPFLTITPKEKRRYRPGFDLSINMYSDPGRPKTWEASD